MFLQIFLRHYFGNERTGNERTSRALLAHFSRTSRALFAHFSHTSHVRRAFLLGLDGFEVLWHGGGVEFPFDVHWVVAVGRDKIDVAKAVEG